MTREQDLQQELMIRQVHEEIKAQNVKVVRNRYYTTKAEMLVYRDEVDKLLVQAAVQCLDSETQALAKCFTIA